MEYRKSDMCQKCGMLAPAGARGQKASQAAPERSNSWIGEDCGIKHETVATIRKELEDKAEIASLGRFLGRDGTWRFKQIEEPEEEKPKVEPIKLYKGDMLEVLPRLGQQFDLVIALTPRAWGCGVLYAQIFAYYSLHKVNIIGCNFCKK